MTEDWQDVFGDIQQNVSFAAIQEVVDRAATDSTTPDGFMTPKDRSDAVWMYTPDVACSVVFWPGNRSATLRFAHAYVVPEARGMGHGKAHVLYRYEYAKQHPDCDRVDSLLARDPTLFQQLGFDIVEWRGADNSIAYVAKTFD